MTHPCQVVLLLFFAFDPVFADLSSTHKAIIAPAQAFLTLKSKLPPLGGPWYWILLQVISLCIFAAIAALLFFVIFGCLKSLRKWNKSTLWECGFAFLLSGVAAVSATIMALNSFTAYRTLVPVSLAMITWMYVGTTTLFCVHHVRTKRRERKERVQQEETLRNSRGTGPSSSAPRVGNTRPGGNGRPGDFTSLAALPPPSEMRRRVEAERKAKEQAAIEEATRAKYKVEDEGGVRATVQRNVSAPVRRPAIEDSSDLEFDFNDVSSEEEDRARLEKDTSFLEIYMTAGWRMGRRQSQSHGPQHTSTERRMLKRKLNLWQKVYCKPLIFAVLVMLVLTLAWVLGDACRGNDGNLYNGCNSFCPCKAGYSCDPWKLRCFHSPRQADEPCLGFSCADGLACGAGSLCSDGGYCGSLCAGDGDCKSELRCELVEGFNFLQKRICVSSSSECSSCASQKERLSDCLSKDKFNAPVAPIDVTKMFAKRYSVWEEYPQCRATVLQQGCCGSCVAFSVGAEIAVNQCIQDSRRRYIDRKGWREAVADAILVHRRDTDLYRGSRFVRLSEQMLLECSADLYGDDMKVNAKYWNTTWVDSCDGFHARKEHEMISKYGVAPYPEMEYIEGDSYWLSDVCTDDINDVPCKFFPHDIVAGLNCTPVSITSFEQAKDHLIRYGPLVGSLNPSNLSFSAESVSFWYTHQILNSTRGSGHQVLIFGFGQGSPDNSTQRYLMVHNSWGSSWGNFGEVLVAYSAFEDLDGCVPLQANVSLSSIARSNPAGVPLLVKRE